MSDSRTIAESCGCITKHSWYEGSMGNYGGDVEITHCWKHGGLLPHYPLLAQQIEGYKTLINDLGREYDELKRNYALKQRIEYLEKLLKFHRIAYPSFDYKK
jgi:hypothetical protein